MEIISLLYSLYRSVGKGPLVFDRRMDAIPVKNVFLYNIVSKLGVVVNLTRTITGVADRNLMMTMG